MTGGVCRAGPRVPGRAVPRVTGAFAGPGRVCRAVPRVTDRVCRAGPRVMGRVCRAACAGPRVPGWAAGAGLGRAAHQGARDEHSPVHSTTGPRVIDFYPN